MLFSSDSQIVNLLVLLLWMVSMYHIYIDSKRMSESGWVTFSTMLMITIVIWPLGYLIWLFYWPAFLRHRFMGTEANVLKRDKA